MMRQGRAQNQDPKALDRLRQVSDLLLAIADRIRDIEGRKRSIPVGSPRFIALAEEISALSAELGLVAEEQEELGRTNRDRAGIENRTPVRGRRSVLVVDDEATLRQMVVMALRTFGYDAVAVPDAETALELIQGGTPVDLVLTDIRMPGMNGVELARRLCDVAPGLPVALMSGADLPDVAREFRATPPPVLAKPFSVTALHAFVEQVAPEAVERCA